MERVYTNRKFPDMANVLFSLECCDNISCPPPPCVCTCVCACAVYMHMYGVKLDGSPLLVGRDEHIKGILALPFFFFFF